MNIPTSSSHFLHLSRNAGSPKRIIPPEGGEDFPDGGKPAPLHPGDISPDADTATRKKRGDGERVEDDADDGDGGD